MSVVRHINPGLFYALASLFLLEISRYDLSAALLEQNVKYVFSAT